MEFMALLDLAPLLDEVTATPRPKALRPIPGQSDSAVFDTQIPHDHLYDLLTYSGECSCKFQSLLYVTRSYHSSAPQSSAYKVYFTTAFPSRHLHLLSLGFKINSMGDPFARVHGEQPSPFAPLP